MTTLLTSAQRVKLINNGDCHRSVERLEPDPLLRFDPFRVVKLFTPDAIAVWLLVELDPECTPFPSLYIAEDPETALLEKFGKAFPDRGRASTFAPAELALRSPSSFTLCRLRGQVDRVLDVRDPVALKPFVDVIRTFGMPRGVKTLSRALGFRAPPWLLRSVSRLQHELTKSTWRALRDEQPALVHRSERVFQFQEVL